MWKAFLAGVVAIGLLVAGSVAALLALTRDDGPRSHAAQPSPEATGRLEPDAGAVLLQPGAATYGTVPPPAPAPIPEPTTAPPPPPPPPPGSWEAIPITARAKSLGRLGGLIQARLNDLQDELRACFTADAQARYGSTAISMVRDAQPMDNAGSVVLVLQLEAGAGSVRIVDAPLEARGPAGDELIACAQNLLRSKVLEVPGIGPGAKYRLLYTLTP